MESMTEEEAFALDEYYTKNPPEVDPSKTGRNFRQSGTEKNDSARTRIVNMNLPRYTLP